MAGNNEHPPKARALGAELRECRIAAGVKQRELANQLDVSYVSISRYETGARTPKPEDVAQILATLGVVGAKYDELVDMARDADQPNWLDTSHTGIRRELTTLIEFERTAQRITDVATIVIPGLLQTSDYARAILGETSNDVDARVAMRVGRRDALMRRDAPEFVALIWEVALREPLGGYRTMVDQLHHITAMAERPNITVQILPAGSTRWHPAHAGSFILFNFPKSAPIVHVEHFHSTAFLHKEKDVLAYEAATTTLQQLAMSPEDSVGLIAKIRDEMEGQA
ncbi:MULTISPECIES: helix-turn-helix transcriptional regulator [unclassified Actinopolyspora]|uniref:helix-turn-helix domain-containing protein n=1 Tax=unclassified Actinopolyspora TaxID=2639451 RepID=UPI0013F6492C|nr:MULTISPECIES: helix-turn-helix transcriptional regulator [unclassified Actinopolyspora]NHD16759.1 helix-turn-helix domain-containing protein [Actinopolyspora sp. BKK2]NHE75378.1 helix-turn-helix domain-containing protein [Actinopolyspora sp. BKK1]